MANSNQGINSMEQAIERLKASKDELFLRSGALKGRQWALEVASFEELFNFVRNHEIGDYVNNRDVIEEWAGLDQYDQFEDDERCFVPMALGFVGGVCQAWISVKDHI